MWWDVAPEMQSEFEDWHTHEHMPERLAIPGFLRGSRWIAASGEPSYFVLYETSSIATITRGAYVRRLNHPTSWSRKLMPHHRNMVRSLCRIRASYGGGLSGFMGTLRFSQSSSVSKAIRKLPQRKGLGSACWLRALSAADTPRTAEQAIRGGDRRADAVLLVGGYDADAVGAALAAHRALPDAVGGVYRLVHSLSKLD
jgi:hypothetical protein